jgi:hypothetical protein
MISAGYYVTLWKSEPWVGPPGLTVSDCLAHMAPDWWGLGWTSTGPNSDPLFEAARFGVTQAQLPALQSWASAAFDAGEFLFPHAFRDVGTAQECARRLPHPGVRLLGLSFTESVAARLLETFRPAHQGSGPPGAYECVSESRPPAAGGSLRGFEIVGYVPTGQFESHRCHGLEADFRAKLGVALNEWGLVDAAEAALQCADYVNALEGHTCADLWLPGQIVEYEL